MADVFVREHKMSSDGVNYNDVYRITKARAVETADGQSVETKVAESEAHAANKTNPHGVTAAQVPYTPLADGFVTDANVQKAVEKMDAAYKAIHGRTKTLEGAVDAHTGNKANPHGVTAAQVGADAAGSANQALADAKKYTDQQISAIPTPDVSGQIEAHNTNPSAHADIRTELAGKEKAGAAAAVQTNLDAHAQNKANPHGVTAAQVGARPNTWMPTAADVGAVPVGRKVNGKSLSADVTLGAADVGAVPTGRTVNGKPLSGNVTLVAGDVGADAAGSSAAALADAKKYADQKAADMVTAPAGGNMTIPAGMGAGPYTIEFTPEADSDISASQIAYQNATTGMKATTAQGAIDELHQTVQNAGGKPKATRVTLTTAGWDASAKTQTVTVAGVLADETKQLIMPMPAMASQNAYAAAGIACTAQAANALTFTAQTVPTENITVFVTVQEVTA